MPYSTLHGEAAKVFEEIYNKALDTYKGDKQKAAQTAWHGLKGAGYRKNDAGDWTKTKSAIAEMSMSIIKASYDKRDGGAMRFRAVASDTDPDLYTEAMSPELFQDFVNRIENNIPVPEEFKSAICEDTWCGGLPYPSISHFRSGPQGTNVPGKIESVYVDGNRLKSTGVLHDTELGRAVFKSLLDDLYAKKSDADHLPVRISIGFLDLKHSHIGNGMNYTFERKNLVDQCPMCARNVGGKVYQKGVLVHEAFTRVPVNPRTEAEVERSMSDAIVTKKDDAVSIIGDLAEGLVDKSKAEVLVVKGDGTVEKGTVTQEPELKGRNPGEGKQIAMADASLFNDCYDPNTGMFNQECIDQAVMGHQLGMRKAMAANNPVSSNRNGTAKDPEVPANDVPGKWLSLVKMFSTTKKEPDGEHPASHYLYVGDSSKPSTWHLPVKDKGGKISPRHLGAAHTALTKGFRGQKYGGPGKGKALAKLRNLYKQAGIKWPEDASTKEKSVMETKGKIQGAPVPGSPAMMDVLDGEDALYPEVPSKEDSVNPGHVADTEMGEPAGTYEDSITAMKAGAKPFAGKETAAEENAEKKPKAKMEKALVLAAKSLIQEVTNLKEQGVYGDMALQSIQPHMNNFGEAIRRSLTYSGGNSEMAAALAALTEQVAVLRAQLATNGQVSTGQVQRSGVPASRVITFNPATMSIMQQQSQASGELGGLTTDKRPFSQISSLARKSVGL